MGVIRGGVPAAKVPDKKAETDESREARHKGNTFHRQRETEETRVHNHVSLEVGQVGQRVCVVHSPIVRQVGRVVVEERVDVFDGVNLVLPVNVLAVLERGVEDLVLPHV